MPKDLRKSRTISCRWRELKSKYGMAGILVSGTVDDGIAVEREGFKFLPKPLSLQKLLDILELL